MNIEIPPILDFLLVRGKYRYKVVYGGRGAGGKSWNIARALLILASQNQKLRILCCREFMNSVSESVHALLKDQIEKLGFEKLFDIQRDVIRCKNGSEFIFIGLHNNTSKIKSMEGVDIAWIEEGETISKQSWTDLTPTIRKPGSEIWVTFNPRDPSDPTSKMFIEDPPPPDSIIVKVTTDDNPDFPAVLRAEMEHDYRTDPDLAIHKWGGEYRQNSDSQIFRNKYVIDAFEPKASWSCFLGADHGFAQDPATVIKSYLEQIYVEGRLQRKLYIAEEAWGLRVDLTDLEAFFSTVNGTRFFHQKTGVLLPNQPPIGCDNARPEIIAHLAKCGFNTIGVKKSPGSVMSGIIWLRGIDQIVIHPRCVKTAEEFRLYSWKKDKLTQAVSNVPVDKFNHCIDAIRYSLEPLINTEQPVELTFDGLAGTVISGDLDMFDLEMERTGF